MFPQSLTSKLTIYIKTRIFLCKQKNLKNQLPRSILNCALSFLTRWSDLADLVVNVSGLYVRITLFLFPLAPFQAECDALEQEATLSGRLEVIDT